MKEKGGVKTVELPVRFVERMTLLCGDEWRSEGDEAARGLRVNTLKCSPASAGRHLPLGEPLPFSPFGFAALPSLKAGKDPFHHAGAYYMQEPSAMSAVTVLDPRPGERVLDLCAAPGGKSTQIAAALGGHGLLWCNEYVSKRAHVLVQNLERCGVVNAVVTSMDSARLCPPLSGWFDAVLVDAPCSGEGMFRKEPDALAMWSEENVRACAARSAEILDNAAKTVRAGGRLLLSTCTYAPEENECQTAYFLKRHPDFELVRIDVPFGRAGFSAAQVAPFASEPLPEADLTATRRIFPADGGEGHFLALFRRKGEEPCAKLPCYSEDKVAAAVREAVAEWAGELPEGVLCAAGDTWRLMPPDTPQLRGISYLMAGVALAEQRKNRLMPTHAWAMALGDRATQTLALLADDQNLPRFLRGESVPFAGRGYAAVTVEGVSVGFGKGDGRQLKNHYPKGLRLLG